MKHSGARLNIQLLLSLFLTVLGSLAGQATGAAAGLIFGVGSANGQPTTQVLVPVQASGFNDINSLQFSFHWSAAVASFVDVEQFGIPGLASGNFGTTLANNGTLTVSWDDPDGTS